MDAVEFIKQLRRMIEKGARRKCYIYPDPDRELDPAEDVVSEVEQWSKENPIKTRQSEILKMFSNAHVNDDGVLTLCPQIVDVSYNCPFGQENTNGRAIACINCKKAFWMQEVE